MSDDFQWWVLIDPANDGWKRVTEAEAKDYAVVECRLTTAIPADRFEDIYNTRKPS